MKSSMRRLLKIEQAEYGDLSDPIKWPTERLEAEWRRLIDLLPPEERAEAEALVADSLARIKKMNVKELLAEQRKLGV